MTRAPIDSRNDAAVLALVVIVGAVFGWVWTTAQVAAWVTGRGWLGITARTLLSAVPRVPGHLGDLRSAWPAPARARLPGTVAMNGCAIAVIVAAAGGALGATRFVRPRSMPHHRGAKWANGGDVSALRVRCRARTGRLILGRRDSSWIGRGALVATESRHSVLVVGPTQSGKTSGLAIPAILEWQGPVVATSVKDDLARTTAGWRVEKGPVWVFDPTWSSGLAGPAGWSPLDGCTDWSSAQKVAAWLVDATPARQGMADAAFWYAAAAKQLAPLLLAAKSGALPMSSVLRWTNACDYAEPGNLLAIAGEVDASMALHACEARDSRIQSSVATTLETVLAPFEDPVVAASTERSEIDVRALLETNGTLFLCGPSHEQHRVQGLFATLVSCTLAAVVERVNELGGPLDPPLLLVLDEAANIAPIRDLDTLASTGAATGVQIVTICQDLAQLAARYGNERSRTIANNHRAKLLLSGVSDLATLDLISGLAGEQAVREHTFTRDLRDGGGSRATATAYRRLAPSDELRRIPPGRGVLVYGHLPPVRIKLRPWFADRALRRRADG